MKVAIIGLLVVLALVSSSIADSNSKYESACTYTGVRATDDAACAGNLLCAKDNECDCPDDYPGYSGAQKYTAAADGLSCVPK